MVASGWHKLLPSSRGKQAVWVGDTVHIVISVDDAGRVTDTDSLNRRATESTLDNLLWRAKRQWHRWFP
jgi:hypothetical protein